MALIPGTETEKGIVGFLDDLFGPAVREVGQGLGEWVRYQRGKRLRATLSDAVDLAKERNANLAPPPPKFLLPFLENASLEADETLNRMWAELLVDAGCSYSSGHPIYVDILRRLDANTAQLFEAIVERPQSRSGALSQLEDKDLQGRTWPWEWRLFECQVENEEEWMARFVASTSSFGLVVWSYHHSFEDDKGRYAAECADLRFVENYGEGELSLSALKAVGIVDDRIIEVQLDGQNQRISIQLVWVTRLGAEFYFATHDRRSRIIPGDRPYKEGGYPDSDKFPQRKRTRPRKRKS